MEVEDDDDEEEWVAVTEEVEEEEEGFPRFLSMSMTSVRISSCVFIGFTGATKARTKKFSGVLMIR